MLGLGANMLIKKMQNAETIRASAGLELDENRVEAKSEGKYLDSRSQHSTREAQRIIKAKSIVFFCLFVLRKSHMCIAKTIEEMSNTPSEHRMTSGILWLQPQILLDLTCPLFASSLLYHIPTAVKKLYMMQHVEGFIPQIPPSPSQLLH